MPLNKEKKLISKKRIKSFYSKSGSIIKTAVKFKLSVYQVYKMMKKPQKERIICICCKHRRKAEGLYFLCSYCYENKDRGIAI